ncbi:expressed unknown protein [Seminavis robusta]|uniref:Uncharacterized protein n=1 Tax=Seminavis robusta TaxID=568900 RepID=A0A9N8EHE9_9STRA|nr:expressed unknown protein [Seminavis robusta]|eukprot:Sro1102_g241570.1 n/a (141) ;mRNA; r:17382-17804
MLRVWYQRRAHMVVPTKVPCVHQMCRRMPTFASQVQLEAVQGEESLVLPGRLPSQMDAILLRQNLVSLLLSRTNYNIYSGDMSDLEQAKRQRPLVHIFHMSGGQLLEEIENHMQLELNHHHHSSRTTEEQDVKVEEKEEE